MYSPEWEKKRILETFFILISDAVENGYNKSYNRFTRELALESVLRNKDTIKASLANAEYISRQMLSEDVVEIAPDVFVMLKDNQNRSRESRKQ